MTVTAKVHPGIYKILVPFNIFILTAAAGQRKPDVAPDVTVNLHNSIVAAPGTVERAKQVATKMFASIGINIQWRSSDSEPQQGLSIDVSLTSDHAVGATGYITVPDDRVHNWIGGAQDLEPVLLAHVLVHEMTHVLQRLDRHSDSGVMKSHWTPEDYFDMSWKPLTFTQEDIELIHLGMSTWVIRWHIPGIRVTYGFQPVKKTRVRAACTG